MIKIAICDDETAIVGQIDTAIRDVADKMGIAVDINAFFSGGTIEKAVEDGDRFDLLFLDIQMSDMNGIETAQRIREIDEDVLLIFVSGYDEYVLELFRLDVFDFIKKPIDTGKLRKCFLAAYDKITERQVFFHFQYGGEYRKVPVKNILWFESVGRQIRIHLRDEKVEIFNGKLNSVEERLGKSKIPFIRIHQSYLVNYQMIIGKSQSKIRMYGEKELPISDERKNSVKTIYNQLLGGEISV